MKYSFGDAHKEIVDRKQASNSRIDHRGNVINGQMLHFINLGK